MTEDQILREHLVKLLEGRQAHLNYEDILSGVPSKAQSKHVKRTPHTLWQVLEHLRIAQWDILEFSRNPHHRSPKWPDEYWPTSAEPETAAQWNRTAAQIKLDLDAMKALVEDRDSDLLTPFGWGEGQTLLREALLVADHNAYHLGELMTLRRLLSAARDASSSG